MASRLESVREGLSLLFFCLWMSVLCAPHVLAGLFYLVFPRPRKNVKNDIVLVTGSGQGLGRELALLFAEQGCEVVCVDLSEEDNLATVAEIRGRGGAARAYICNVADRSAVMKLGQQVGRVDILVNNAGIYPYRSLWNSNEEDIRTIIDVNLFSQFWTIQAFLPGMKERNHGHVVCMSSLSAITGLCYLEAYSASKGGVAALMSSVKQELQMEKKNVKMTTVYPYFVKTRAEITECVGVRIPLLNRSDAARTIMQGILEELDSFTVPRSFMHVANLLRTLPSECTAVCMEHMNLTVSAPAHDEFQEYVESGVFVKTGELKEQKSG